LIAVLGFVLNKLYFSNRTIVYMIDDIAKKLGVSKTTVSRAINGNGRVSEHTRNRILKYIDEIGFVPNAAAKNLATTKTRNIAFSMPLNSESVRSAYFLECFFGASKVAVANSFDVIMVGDDAAQAIRIIHSRKADGVIFTRNSVGDEQLENLLKFGIPIAVTGSACVPGVIQVGYKAHEAFSDLTSRLIDKWEGEVGLIVGKKVLPSNQTRAEGFTEAYLSKRKTGPLILWDADDEDEVYKAFNTMYDSGINNIICGDDVVCLDLLNVIKGGGRFKRKYEVGKNNHGNINIASFHSSHYLETFHPEIPVVRLNTDKLGNVACKILIDKINGKDVPMSTFLDYELIY